MSAHLAINKRADGIVLTEITRLRNGGDKAADNSAANDGSGKTTSKTLTFTMSAGTDTENGKRLCRQATAWLVVHARRYGIDSLCANGMRWNRTDGVWAGTETGELTITATLA